MLTKTPFLLIYVALALLYLWADHNGIQTLVYFTKPALVTLLLVYFYRSVRQYTDWFSRLLIAGLVFSVAGDVFLMFPGDQYFMLGLGSFLLTHLLYTKAFCSYASCSPLQLLTARRLQLVFLLPVLIAIMYYLWPAMGSLRIPVLIYGVAIVLMCLAAFNLAEAVPAKVFPMIYIGALLFIFSDSIIALDKFKGDQLVIPFPRLLIMIPYLTAQYMIIKGSIQAYETRYHGAPQLN